MSDTFYKPLTPDLRGDINRFIDISISDLCTCEQNAFVNVQIIGYKALRNIINALPDGYPLPIKKEVNEVYHG